ncbi:uncharacterized protein LOC108931425 [Scleropages formosus]|uniref:uncharacterized protein LOC108931425 n=1 Tax=Scleropages formosus TaxID=113540 RepID=UPI000878618A|nr:uncharacterized protein LOC108931425 [Scleropages formosus]
MSAPPRPPGTFGTHVQTLSRRGDFIWEMGARNPAYSMTPVEARGADHVTTLHVRGNRFLSTDTKGTVCTPTVSWQHDCLFPRVKRQSNILGPNRSGLQLTRERAQPLQRQRRALLLEHREPRREPHSLDGRQWGSQSASPQRAELLEQSLSISRESITSIIHDDPLEVLKPMNPSSPQNTGASGQTRLKRWATRRPKSRDRVEAAGVKQRLLFYSSS